MSFAHKKKKNREWPSSGKKRKRDKVVGADRETRIERLDFGERTEVEVKREKERKK